MFTVGDTTTLLPLNAPGFQVYVDAPDAVSVAELPIQREGEAGLIVMLGTGLTFWFTVKVLWQPNAFTPVTE